MKLSELIGMLMCPETYECVEVYEADEEDGSYTFKDTMTLQEARLTSKNVSNWDVDKNKGERYHLMIVFG